MYIRAGKNSQTLHAFIFPHILCVHSVDEQDRVFCQHFSIFFFVMSNWHIKMTLIKDLLYTSLNGKCYEIKLTWQYVRAFFLMILLPVMCTSTFHPWEVHSNQDFYLRISVYSGYWVCTYWSCTANWFSWFWINLAILANVD